MHFFKMITATALLLSLTAVPAVPQGLSVTEKVLPNGLKVLLKEEHKAPVATFQIWYKVGSRNEQLGKTGLSHLLEHMMFKGTKKYGPKHFSRTVMKNGGNDNAFTSRDYTAYFENFASDRIYIALELESDRMQNLLLDPKEFESERKVVMEERRMRYEDDPVSIMIEQMTATAFLAHPYQWPVIGWMADLESITRDDLYRHYKTYYVPNNATIVVVGDFDTEKILPQIEKYFGRIPRGPQPPKAAAREPKQTGERRIVVKREAELPAVFVGYHTPNLVHRDSYALEVIEAILSAGRSSRIYRSLIYEKQIALDAGGGYDRVSADPNLFYVYAEAMPGKKPEDVEAALYTEIDRLKTEPVTDEELQRAKNQIEAGFIMSQDSVFYQAMLLGRYETVGNWRLLDEYLDGVRAVTKEDIRRVASEYFTEDNRTVGILMPIKSLLRK